VIHRQSIIKSPVRQTPEFISRFLSFPRHNSAFCRCGASSRTLQRLFASETGLRFAEWRRRLRLLHAAALLSAGASVTDAGLDAGYQSTSAFIAAFQRQLGDTPLRYRNGRSQSE
jgi:methylphosphotriester-DNA--protein-cysteine methyltransferase